jgi:hypothetical protein
VPKHLTARPPFDATEERHVRKLTHSMHAKIVAHSWDGLRTQQIAEALACHPQTVRDGCRPLTSVALRGGGILGEGVTCYVFRGRI